MFCLQNIMIANGTNRKTINKKENTSAQNLRHLIHLREKGGGGNTLYKFA